MVRRRNFARCIVGLVASVAAPELVAPPSFMRVRVGSQIWLTKPLLRRDEEPVSPFLMLMPTDHVPETVERWTRSHVPEVDQNASKA